MEDCKRLEVHLEAVCPQVRRVCSGPVIMALLLTVLSSAKPELKALVEKKDTERLSAHFAKDREGKSSLHGFRILLFLGVL